MISKSVSMPQDDENSGSRLKQLWGSYNADDDDASYDGSVAESALPYVGVDDSISMLGVEASPAPARMAVSAPRVVFSEEDRPVVASMASLSAPALSSVTASSSNIGAVLAFKLVDPQGQLHKMKGSATNVQLLRAAILKKLSLSDADEGTVSIGFEDEDKDVVQLSSADDLAEALEIRAKTGRLLVRVTVMSNDVNNSPLKGSSEAEPIVVTPEKPSAASSASLQAPPPPAKAEPALEAKPVETAPPPSGGGSTMLIVGAIAVAAIAAGAFFVVRSKN